MALALAEAGAHVALVSRDETKLNEVATQIRENGGRATVFVADVADEAQVEGVRDGFAAKVGRSLHILINNAGLQEQTPFLELDLKTWRAQLAVDLDGPFLLSVAAGKLMSERGGGVILNVTSVHEHQPRPGYAAYCTAKAGLGMLTKVLARELAPYGIRALAVAPGAIETPIQGEQSEQDKKEQRDGIPAGRVGTAAEVAALVAYLVSPAAAYVSGTTVVIDGALETQVSLA